MLTILYSLILSIITPIAVFAADMGVLWNFEESKIKTGDIHINDIPNILTYAIDFFMWIAWTISVIFIIIGAYQILLGSLEQDKTKGKTTVVLALTWFAIASLSWFIVKFILDNFG